MGGLTVTSEAPSSSQGAPLRCRGRDSERRCVQFNLEMNTVHEVIPYSEVYGAHPRKLKLNTEGAFATLLADGMVESDADSSDDEDEQDCKSWAHILRHCRLPFPPWLLWSLMTVCCFLL